MSDIKKLFRAIANLIHPDRAVDDTDRQMCSELMAEANVAYDKGDGEFDKLYAVFLKCEAYINIRAKTSAIIIAEAEKFLSAYVVLPDNRFLLPLILWAAHTHAWELAEFEAVSYVNFTGMRGSGKNHAIHALGSMCNTFEFIARGTEAALRDTIHDRHPTLGVAECEDDLKKHNSYVHKLFNSGYVPGEPWYKEVGGVPTPFQVFCPKMMATIGNVEESLHDRCIVVPMKIGNPLVFGDNFSNGAVLGRQLSALVAQHAKEINTIYYSKSLKRPERLEGRDWQTMRPLYAVCRVLVPERLRELENCATYIAALKLRPLQSVKDMHELHTDYKFAQNSRRVLKDAALVLTGFTGKNVGSEDLCKRLVAMEDGHWDGYGASMGGRLATLADGQRGQQLLAKMFLEATGGKLKPSDIPLYISKGVNKRGYVVSEIREAARALSVH